MGLDRLSAAATAGGFFVAYNGYTFGPSADTTFFHVRPNPDPSGRTVATVTYTITVKETLHFDTEAALAAYTKSAIAKLERNGGKLRYVGRGFGDLDINVFGGQNDVRWGPWTKELSFVPTGAGLTHELTWTVEITTICPDELGKAGTIIAFSYTVAYDVDREGYQTRTYEGTLTIGQTRKSATDRTLQASADEHLEKMTPALLSGFRREHRSRRLDPSKCTLTLTVTDVQLPGNLPPARVVDGSIEHTWHSQGLFHWSGNIGATFDIARREGTPLDAIDNFLRIVKGRIDEARKMISDPAAFRVAAGPLGDRLREILGPAVDNKPVAIYLAGAHAAEPNVLGRTQVRLGVQYMAVGCNFAEILRSGGLWRPVRATNEPDRHWREWVASMPSVFAPRGHADLRFDPKDDAIVDACVRVEPRTIRDAPPGAPQTIRNAPGTFNGLINQTFPAPAAAESWIHYENFITIHPRPGTVVGQTLPGVPLNPTQSSGGAFNALFGPQQGAPNLSSPFRPLAGLLKTPAAKGGETFVHHRGRPQLYVTISGQALRGGWQIPVPELVEVNGTRPVLVGTPVFRTGITAHCQVPIVYADWSLTYLCTDDGGIPSRAIPVPPNPFLA